MVVESGTDDSSFLDFSTLENEDCKKVVPYISCYMLPITLLYATCSTTLIASLAGMRIMKNKHRRKEKSNEMRDIV